MSYEEALKEAKKLNKTTFDFIEGVNVLTATLVGNAAVIKEKGTIMKGGYIKLK